MKIAVTGGTGLIGREILQILSKDKNVSEIVAIVRARGAKIPKVKWVEANLNSISALKEAILGCEKSLCALGTTMKKAGSREAFEKVDYHFILNFAKASKEVGIETFGLVSAIGSDPNSSVFYNRVKGKTERAVKELSFENLIIAQPSILLGDRQEYRLGEKIGIAVMRALSPLMFGSLKKYRPIQAYAVANSLWTESKTSSKKVAILQYEELNRA